MNSRLKSRLLGMAGGQVTFFMYSGEEISISGLASRAGVIGAYILLGLNRHTRNVELGTCNGRAAGTGEETLVSGERQQAGGDT